MNERGPFANWPRLEGAVREISVDDAQRFSKPIDMESQTMASKNNALENFLGGAPMNVLARLFFISLVVGALMMWLELRPIENSVVILWLALLLSCLCGLFCGSYLLPG